jgi:fructose-specific phosphotransferase system IIC component
MHSHNTFGSNLTKAFNKFIPYIIAYSLLMIVNTLDWGILFVFNWMESILYILLAPILAYQIGRIFDGPRATLPNLFVGLLAGYYQTTFMGGLVVGLITHFFLRLFDKKDINLVVSIGLIIIIETCVVYFGVVPLITFVIDTINTFLISLRGNNTVILVMALAGLTAVDLGGPLNKTAFAFVITVYLEGFYEISGPALIAVGIPPLGMAFTAFLIKDFEVNVSPLKTALLGMVGLTEGALPYASKYPYIVIPAVTIGSMIASGFAALVGIENRLFLGSVVGIFGANRLILFLFAFDVGVFSVFLISFLLIKFSKKTEPF